MLSSNLNRRDFMAATGGLAAVALVPELARAAPFSAAPIGIAVIGAGRQGRVLMAELQKLDAARVTVLCDDDPSRLRSGLGRAPGAEGVEDWRAAIEKPGVDAVVIATPTHLHREIAQACIAADKHVYCEAPLAHTVDDTWAIASAAIRSRKVFAVGCEGRSNPVYQLARTFYRSDSVRDLIMMRAQHVQKTSWRFPAQGEERDRRVNWRLDPRVSVGLAGELGTHQFDVLHWYTGGRPVRVGGGGSVRLHDDGRTVADTIVCEIVYDNGARLAYLATLGSSFEGRHEILFGSSATIKLAWSHGWMFKEADAPTQGWEVYANRQQFHQDEGITLIADATQLASQGKLEEGVGLPHPSAYYALEDFIRAMVEGTPVGCDAVEGARSTVTGILLNQAVIADATHEVDPAKLELPARQGQG